MKKLIKNGTVCTAEGHFLADVLIDGEKIAAVTAPGMIKAKDVDEIINAKGMYLTPGAIDSHVHIEEPFQGLTPDEDWFDGTANAALGGVTTVMNFCIQQPGEKLMTNIKRDYGRVGSMACVDYTFHGVFSDYTNIDSVLDEIDDLFKFGVPSLKAFMIYSSDGLYCDDWSLYKIMQKVAKKGGYLGLHAENMGIGENKQVEMKKEGLLDSKYWPDTKPEIVEEEAVRRACLLSQYTGCRTYIAHTSTGVATDAVKEYQAKGAPIVCEGCSHYFALDRDLYKKEGVGVWEIISPPLRDKSNHEKLWNAINNGSMVLIGSDHNAYGKVPKDKAYAVDGCYGVSNGGPGIIENTNYLFAEGAMKKKITLERFVEITSTNSAKMFGIYPQKGTIAPGSDADIVIWDPKKVKTMSVDLYRSMDWTPYEGMKFKGAPVRTMVRGETVINDGVFVGKKGSGKFVPGKIDESIIKTVR